MLSDFVFTLDSVFGDSLKLFTNPGTITPGKLVFVTISGSENLEL